MALGKLDQDFINLKIKFDKEQAEKSVKTIKQELRQAQEEALKLGRKFGENSKEANEAAKKVANLKDEVGDFKQKVDALNPDKFARFSTATNGIVRGFQAAQGAAVLFGNESEDLQKSLVKLQAVMAFADGIQGVMDTTKAFSGLGNTIKNSVVKAFTTLKGAIIGTGIGALAIALGYVITNFDKVKAAVERFLPGLATLAKYVGVIVEKFTDWVGITSEADRALDKLTKKNEYANKEIERRIKILEAQKGKEREVYLLKKQLIDNELAILRKKQEVDKGFTMEEKQRFEDLKADKQILEIEELNRIDELSAKKREKLKKAAEDELKEQQKIDEFFASWEKEANEEADKRRADQKAREAKEIEDAKNLTTKEFQESIKNTQAFYDQEKLNATNRHLEGKTTQEQYAKEVEDLKIQEAIALLTVTKDYGQSSIEYEQQIADAKVKIKDEESKKKLADEKAYQQAVKSLVVDGSLSLIATLQSLNATFAGQSESQQKKAFKRNKALAIADATISTYTSATKAYESQFNPPTIASPALGAIAAGIAVASGLAKIAQISKTTFMGSGGGGGASAVGSSGSVSPRVASTGFTSIAPPTSPQGQTQTKTDPIQVYVLEKDIKKSTISADNRQAKAIVK